MIYTPRRLSVTYKGQSSQAVLLACTRYRVCIMTKSKKPNAVGSPMELCPPCYPCSRLRCSFWLSLDHTSPAQKKLGRQTTNVYRELPSPLTLARHKSPTALTPPVLSALPCSSTTVVVNQLPSVNSPKKYEPQNRNRRARAPTQ